MKNQTGKTDVEWFGSAKKVTVGKVDSHVKTLTHSLDPDQAEQLSIALQNAVSHYRRAEHQQKKGIKKRSILEPINSILLTTHLSDGQITVLGRYEKSRAKTKPK